MSNNKEISKDSPVLVTGGTGYIASWIIKYLLEKGYSVRATVRDKSNKTKNKNLFDLMEKHTGKLELFEANLLTPNAFKKAMSGCELVMHTASPFVISVDNPQKQLIEPALEGTRNVLLTANETESVKRIVLTSSVVSIYGDAIDIKNTEKGVFTEEHWNNTSSLVNSPYSYSKKLAEKEAWKIAKDQDKWDLVVINPGFVFGPSLTDRIDSTSIEFMMAFADGTYKTGAAAFIWGVVDVRDVAMSHILAGLRPNASGRHILVSESVRMIEIAKILRNKFGDKYPFPKNEVPTFLLYLLAPIVKLSWGYIRKNIGIPLLFDNSYSKKDLGLEYRTVEETITDHFQQILDDKLLEKKAS